MNKKNILFVGWGTWVSTYPFHVAKRKGLEVFVATGERFPPWLHTYVKKENFILTNPYDTDKLLTDVHAFLRTRGVTFDAVASHFELHVVHAAELAASLSLVGIPPVSARQSSANKYLMRSALARRGIAMPRFMLFRSDEEALLVLRHVGRPAMIKPVMFGHSYGVVKIEKSDTASQIREKLVRARNQLHPAFNPIMADYHNFNNTFMMESYIEGPTISVDGVVQDGRILVGGSCEFVTSPQSFTQMSAYFPARIPPGSVSSCVAYAKTIIRALDFDNCGFHCEMKLTGHGPVLLEIAARLPGGQMVQGYKTAYGVDLMDQYIDICLGRKIPDVPARRRLFACHHSVFTQQSGIFDGIEGLDQLRMAPDVEIFWKAAEGASIEPRLGIPESLLYYQLTAKTRQRLEKRQEEILDSLRYKLHTSPRGYFGRALTRLKGWVSR